MAKKNLDVSQALRYMDEDYKMDMDGADDISEEYALKILSDWIDERKAGTPMQNIFDIVIEGDQLQDHADIIVQSMKDIITDISGEIKAIKVPEVPEYSDDNESDLEGPEEEMEGESSPSEMTNG
jgi:hypothetical protein